MALEATGTGVCERLLGRPELTRMVRELGGDPATAWEAAGWAVRPDRRAGSMGARVVAAGWAVARELGLGLCVGAAGTRYGQLYRILSVGYRRVPGRDPLDVPDLVDEIQFVYATPATLRPGFIALVEHAVDLLHWDDEPPTKVNRMTS